MEKQEILLESGTNEMELLSFLLGSQPYGVNVVKVQSIQQYVPSSVTKVPLAHHAMLGMMLYRNRTIPLIDLSAALGLESEKSNDNKERIVIVTEFNNTVNGFLVDGVERIHRLFWSDFVPMNSVFGSVGAGVTGSINVEKTEIMVVDLEHILSAIIPSTALQDISEETLITTEKQSRENVRIFFAEDSKTIQSNVVRILKKAGYGNLRVFDNGQQAHDALVEIRNRAETKGLPYVMISDIEMPQMDGLTLCKNIKGDDKLKHIIVIMFSSLINKQMIVRCESVGADSYITKPEMDKLVNMLDDMCVKSEKKEDFFKKDILVSPIHLLGFLVGF